MSGSLSRGAQAWGLPLPHTAAQQSDAVGMLAADPVNGIMPSRLRADLLRCRRGPCSLFCSKKASNSAYRSSRDLSQSIDHLFFFSMPYFYTPDRTRLKNTT